LSVDLGMKYTSENGGNSKPLNALCVSVCVCVCVCVYGGGMFRPWNMQTHVQLVKIQLTNSKKYAFACLIAKIINERRLHKLEIDCTCTYFPDEIKI